MEKWREERNSHICINIWHQIFTSQNSTTERVQRWEEQTAPRNLRKARSIWNQARGERKVKSSLQTEKWAPFTVNDWIAGITRLQWEFNATNRDRTSLVPRRPRGHLPLFCRKRPKKYSTQHKFHRARWNKRPSQIPIARIYSNEWIVSLRWIQLW